MADSGGGPVIIGGLDPCSFSDYPGRTAAVIFTRGCNFRCPFCHNPSLLKAGREGVMRESELLAFLEKRRGRLDGVVVTGGEPTLQAGLPGFLARIREMGYPVKLDTNGSNPVMLEQLLAAGLVDYVAMDLKAPPAKYDRLAGVRVDMTALCRTVSLIAKSGVPHHFRTTVVDGLLDSGDIGRIRAELLPAGSRYVLQPYVPVSEAA